MIDLLINALGYTGNDPAISYMVVGFGLSIICGVVYKFISFLFELLLCLFTTKKDFNIN